MKSEDICVLFFLFMSNVMKKQAEAFQKSASQQKAIIFARVSSQAQREGYSLNAQVNRLQEYCKRKDLEIVKEFQFAESSTIRARKGFNDMIDFIKSEHQKSKSAIVLIVDSVDRLQRSFKETPLIDELIKQGIAEVHFYKEGLVLNKHSSSSDMLRWDMNVLFAKSYVSSLSENVRKLK